MDLGPKNCNFAHRKLDSANLIEAIMENKMTLVFVVKIYDSYNMGAL